MPRHEERGEYDVRIRVNGEVMTYTYDFYPLDLVGWDGFLYPYAFSIHDFEPITGRVHQPPPVHQTFEGPGFVVCSFCPRKLDYHPEAVPIPYNHSNIDSDEMIYYVSGSFGSRKGIETSSVTLHPRGIPHGPQPGLVEKSLGAQATDELAVMVDTFRPLKLAADAEALDDPSYPFSWRDERQASLAVPRRLRPVAFGGRGGERCSFSAGRLSAWRDVAAFRGGSRDDAHRQVFRDHAA